MLDRLIELIEAHYIAIDRIPTLIAHLRNLNEPITPKQLTDELRQFDMHFAVFYDPDHAARLLSGQQDEPPLDQWVTGWQQANYGFQQVSILDGNVGYIDLRQFAMPQFAAQTAAAAMQLVAHTRAIIFDLRRNGGGSPEMVQFLCSYLFEGEPKHLNSFRNRVDDSVQQFWTLPYLPGKRLPNTPIYMLTSQKTGSAAEEFAYNLKHMERATIIGETTAGAAHPVDTMALDDEHVIFMPTGAPINPITGTNWEGTGVEPHIHVDADHAMEAALADLMATVSA